VSRAAACAACRVFLAANPVASLAVRIKVATCGHGFLLPSLGDAGARASAAALPAIRRRLAASLSVPWRRSQLARRAYVYFEDEPAGTKLLTRDGVPTHGRKYRYVAAISWIAQLGDSGPPSKPIVDAELDSRDCLLDVDTRNRYGRPRERPRQCHAAGAKVIEIVLYFG
jgi:hypothetical protein